MSKEQEARLLRALEEYKHKLPLRGPGNQHKLLKRVADMHMLSPQTLLIAIQCERKLREEKKK